MTDTLDDIRNAVGRRIAYLHREMESQTAEFAKQKEKVKSELAQLSAEHSSELSELKRELKALDEVHKKIHGRSTQSISRKVLIPAIEDLLRGGKHLSEKDLKDHLASHFRAEGYSLNGLKLQLAKLLAPNGPLVATKEGITLQNGKPKGRTTPVASPVKRITQHENTRTSTSATTTQ